VEEIEDSHQKRVEETIINNERVRFEEEFCKVYITTVILLKYV